ncbi:MAG: type II secretion system protein, partial [Candidatus Saccharimonadales bacterium]
MKKYNQLHASNRSGFTIIELLIVIVVIGILAAIILIAYNGIQHRAVVTTLRSDLRNAATLMQVGHTDTDAYSTTLPSQVKPSPGVSLSLATASGGDVYSGLSSVQNGLLFYNTCQTLLANGVGKKADDGHDYISACTVY